MNLSDIVIKDAILVDLQATTKEEAIREMVQSLRDADVLAAADVEEAVRLVIARENLGSTGIGRKVAVPHSRFDRATRLLGTIALSRHGVEFDALDKEKVTILFLLLSPTVQPGDHLRALETISRHLKSDDFVNFLRQAGTREQVVKLLDETDRTPPLSPS
jgi:mannitol/fructose-specific phosphotransferase system IIA component (Ntr-type)